MQCLWIQLGLVAAAVPTASAFDLMSALLKTPVYKNLLVPASRNMMINTAKENGVPWADAVAWIRGATDWELDEDADVAVPAYYRQPFHAYEPGNLCWEAAWEAEVAGRAVGARNYPAFGAEGEEAFRGAFDDALVAAGARAPGAGDTILDLGCATGHGTRRLAAKFPDAEALVGVDLSPHMLAVARRLPQLCKGEGAAWINVVSDDARVSYARADAASLPFADASQNFVVLSFVAHELPPAATRDVVHEAYRVLRPGGQLWVTEMARFPESEFIHLYAIAATPPRAAGLRDGGLPQAPRVAGVRIHPEHGAVPGRLRGLWRCGRGGGVRRRGLRAGGGRSGDGAPLRTGRGEGRRAGGVRRPARGDQAAGHAPQDVGE